MPKRRTYAAFTAGLAPQMPETATSWADVRSRAADAPAIKPKRQPWARTTWQVAPSGMGSVEVPVGRKAPTPQSYGRQCERDAVAELTKAGYSCTLSHLSRGRADIVAIGPDTVQIQVKGTYTFKPAVFNAGVRELYALPASARREVYGYVHGYGHAVTIALHPDGTLTVSGKGLYKAAVAAALTRMRT